MINVKEPQKVDKVFDEEKYLNLKSLMQENAKNFDYDPGFSRYTVGNGQIEMLQKYAYSLVPMARKLFDSELLLPTYTLFAHYEGENARLHKHKDDNACTYTIDMCVYQDTPWDLWVDGKPYTLHENEALAYYGNDQEHWREEFPDKFNNHVAMIFFHFAEPDHWYFTEGPEYINVVRGNK
jgi:hypothetical protein